MFTHTSANQIACLDGDSNGVCGDAGDIAYGYDACGNLTSDGVKTYSYDAENRLIGVTDGASTTSYTYNGDGDRMSQTVDGITTSYVLDVSTALTQVLAETRGSDMTFTNCRATGSSCCLRMGRCSSCRIVCSANIKAGQYSSYSQYNCNLYFRD